jgi:hypothetical protein
MPSCWTHVCLLAVLFHSLPYLSWGSILSVHVHSVQTIPASAFPHSHVSGVPYQVADLHDSCATALQLREGQSTVLVVPPDTGYPRASFRGITGGVCPSVTNACYRPFVVSFQVSVLRTPSNPSGEELPTMHVAEQLLHSSEPNIAFVNDPPSGRSTLVNPRVLPNNRRDVQALQYHVQSMTSGCGSLNLQLHFVTEDRLEYTSETFLISVPTWGKGFFDFHLLQEQVTPYSPPHGDFSKKSPLCKPVNWDIVDQLTDHRALVAAVELPSPFAIAFVPMFAVPPYESRLEFCTFHDFLVIFLELLCFLFGRVFTLLTFRAVARYWWDISESEKDFGGSFIGDQIYATGLYRSLYCRNRLFC